NVPQRRVQEVRRAQAWLGIGQMKQVREPIVRLGRDCRHFIAQACVEGHIPPQTYVILHVCSEERLASSKHGHGNGNQPDKIPRPVGQEIRKRTELESAVAYSCQKRVVLHALYEHAKLQGMSSFDQSNVVSPLK